MTVLFCDLRGSTALGERTTPAGLVAVIDRYFTVMSKPVRRHGGIIDERIGGRAMASRGPPFAAAAAAPAKLACLAAPGQLAALPDLVGVRHGPPPVGIRVGVGVATGEALVGDIGSGVARSHTVMGRAVDLAARLEGANKVHGTGALVGEEAARPAGDAVELREVDRVLVAGASEPQRVFELLGRAGELDAATREVRDRYAEGLAAYRGGAWDEARAAFAACLEVRPDDGPARVMRERVEELAAKPPGEGWDGMWSLAAK